MTNNTTPNSFFSMVTDKSDKSDEAVVEDNPIPRSESVDEHHGVSSGAPAAIVEPSASDSEMPHDARRVLVYLMRQGSLMAAQKPKLFELVCRYEVAIRKHLSAVYLQLVLDQKSGVAFVASYTSEHVEDLSRDDPDADEWQAEESTTLISRRKLSLYDTLLLLVLRKHYQDREAAGEQKITIDLERLESYLTPFLPITDHSSKDQKKLLARVKEMVKRKVLSNIRGSEDRYEITPIIRYVVSASFLESMLAEYTELASKTAGEGAGIDSHEAFGEKATQGEHA